MAGPPTVSSIITAMHSTLIRLRSSSRQHNLDMCKHLNLATFETVDVQHRTRAFGTLIGHNEGWSVT